MMNIIMMKIMMVAHENFTNDYLVYDAVYDCDNDNHNA